MYQERPNRLIWPHDKNGELTVHPAYALIRAKQKNDESNTASSSVLVHAGFQNFLWNISVPAKIKSFLWKASSNILLVAGNLVKKRASLALDCSFCSSEESIEHMLFGCEWTRAI